MGDCVQRWPALDGLVPSSRPEVLDVRDAGPAVRLILRGSCAAAEAIGISAATVCRIERGQPVSIGVMLKVCAFIGVHPFGYTAPLVCPPEIVSRGTPTETSCSGSDINSEAAAAALAVAT